MSKASSRSWNQTATYCHQTSVTSVKNQTFIVKKKKKKLLLKYLAGLGGSVVFLVFSLCGENDLKYLILISDYFESVLEIDFLL